MRRRQLLLSAALVSVGGCSSLATDGTDATRTRVSEGESPTPTDTPVPTSRATRTTGETAENGTVERAVEAASENLTVAFDELREMRPVGPESIRVSESRFRESDHEVVEDRVEAAVTALDRATAATEDEPVPVLVLRAATDLARAGRELYSALRQGIRAEWQFEEHCYRAEWPAARDRARAAATDVEAWKRHGQAVAGAAEAVDEAVKSADQQAPVSIPRLSLREWYRDGIVLGDVSGPWLEVLRGFGSYSEAVRLDEAGLTAMDAGEHRNAREQFSAALTSVREAHYRLARAKADAAQGFQSYALPIRQRCGPFAKAYGTQLEAAQAAVSGETGRAETLESQAMGRIVEAELEYPLPSPE